MRIILLATVAVASLSVSARAQTTTLEEIVVTARKRDETLLEIPLSVTSVSADKIDKAQIRDIQELFRFTPGFDYKQQNIAFGARTAPSYRFRGMNAGASSSLQQLGGIFIDGQYLFGGVQSITFEDVARVEVIKGPQSAFFGRGTFAGAVNFITKQPSDEFKGRLSGSGETNNSYAGALSLEGPVMPNLKVRASLSRTQQGAHYKASDRGNLGRNRTTALNLTALFEPNDNNTVRIRTTNSWDNDSQSALVDLDASRADITSAKECRPGTLQYWCGELPKLGDAGVPRSVLNAPTSLIPAAFAGATGFILPAGPNPSAKASTTLIDIMRRDTTNPRVRNGFPLQSRLPTLDRMGLKRSFERYSLEYGLEFNGGYTFNAAASDSTAEFLAVLTTRADGSGVSYVPGVFRDTEGEVRLESPSDQRLTWTLGANAFEQKELGAPGGGFQATVGPTNLVTYNEPALYATQLAVKYYGVFGALHYDITEQLAVDLEARWQSDEVISAFGTAAQAAATYKDWAPRAILSYRPMEDLNLYVSWARGIQPGFVNKLFNLLSPALQATVRADPGFVQSVGSETLDSYEVGAKQQLDRFRYAVALYYMDWKNLKNQVLFACPGSVCGPGFNAAFAGITTARTASLKGLEAEIGALIADGWEVAATLEVVDSKFDEFISTTALAATGRISGAGTHIFEYPVAAASLSSGYTAPIGNEFNGYLRGDLTYTGKTYVDEINQAWVGAWYNLNVRTGVETDDMRLEAYVTNLLNNKQWVSGRRGSSVNPRLPGPLQPTAFVQPPRKRAFGVRASYNF
jgi:iron complex outermembrane receptor protein